MTVLVVGGRVSYLVGARGVRLATVWLVKLVTDPLTDLIAYVPLHLGAPKMRLAARAGGPVTVSFAAAPAAAAVLAPGSLAWIAPAGTQTPLPTVRPRVNARSGDGCATVVGAGAVGGPELSSDPEPDHSLGGVDLERFLARVAVLARLEHLTVLASLSRPDAASHFASRVLALADGLLVFDGSPAAFSRLERWPASYGVTRPAPTDA